jgi:6-phosphogluconolactonase
MYTLLGSEGYREKVEWPNVALFWGDERCVHPKDVESNYGLVRETLLKNVPVPEENIHRIRGELDPDVAAREYEKDISAHFSSVEGLPVFDLVILGIGPDGHTASLFPGSGALSESTRLAAPVFALNTWRVTLTLPIINSASSVLFLVTGQSKAQVVMEILREENRKGHPAGLVSAANVTWLLDEAAASLISS